MKYYFRLLWLLLSRRRRAPCPVLGPCRTPFRVWPNDLDVFLHMNNGVYLTIADLGRTDLLSRAGVLGEMNRRRWYPVVAAESIRFRRSLRLWQRYAIDTRVLGWNERSIYLEQVFVAGGETIAHAVIDARFLVRGGGKVTPAEVIAGAAATPGVDPVDADSPALPSWVDDWSAAMRRMEGRFPGSETDDREVGPTADASVDEGASSDTGPNAGAGADEAAGSSAGSGVDGGGHRTGHDDT